MILSEQTEFYSPFGLFYALQTADDYRQYTMIQLLRFQILFLFYIL